MTKLILLNNYSLDTLKQLLATGFDINSKDEYGNTALHNAAANGNLYVIILFSKSKRNRRLFN